jgi:hypothetical protein
MTLEWVERFRLTMLLYHILIVKKTFKGLNRNLQFFLQHGRSDNDIEIIKYVIAH